jgi:large subunit ribosomal protein L29
LSKIAKEFRDMTVAEMNVRIADLKQELFNLRFQHAVNQLDNPQRLKAVKKQIALVNTIRREREIAHELSLSENQNKERVN